MKTFDQFLFGEDAGEKFRAMDDKQFDDYKKANPGAAAKADKLRGTPSTTPSATPKTETKRISGTPPKSRTDSKSQKALPGGKGGAIVKTPADKGSQLVKSKQAKTQQNQQKSSGYMTSPDGPKDTYRNKNKTGTIKVPGSQTAIKAGKKLAGHAYKSLSKKGTDLSSGPGSDIQGNQEIRRDERK